MPNFRTAVVIPVFNQVHLTETCLKSLLANSSEPCDLAVVDNHSTDGTPALLEKMRPEFEGKGWRFQVITNAENRGFGRACNQGIRATGGRFVAVLNNDTWLMPDWDEGLVQGIDRTRAAMVGPYFYEKAWDDRMESRSRRFVKWNAGKSRRFWVPMLMFFRREALDQVGLFDERYFVTFEEIDLRVRFDRAGLEYFMVGDCFIWHHVKGTRGQPGLLRASHEEEGRKIFMEKWSFDPDDLRPGYFSWPERLKRRWQRIRNGLGFM